MTKKLFAVTAVVAAAAIAGAGVVFAAGAVTGRGGPEAQDHASGGGSGKGCGTAWATRTNETDLPTAPSGDYDAVTPQVAAEFVKKCHGGAVATFSTEINVEEEQEVSAQSHNDAFVTIRARCTHPYPGASTPCHVGDLVYPEPNTSGDDDPVFYDLDVDEDPSVRSFQWAWSDLKPGTWVVEVQAADQGGDVEFEYRTLFVQTL